MDPGADHSPLNASWRNRLWLLVILLLLLYVVLPRIADFSTSWHAITQAHIQLVVLAAGLVFLTYCFATSVYIMLAVRGLRFWPTLMVQGSTAFTNRLLPAGLGGLSIYVAYLRKTKHTLPQSLAIAATNNVVGLIAHGLLLAIVIMIGGGSLTGHWHAAIPRQWWLYGAIAVGVLVIISLSVEKLRHRIVRAVSQFGRYVISYRQHPGRLVAALLFAMLITICYVGALYACARAVGLEQSYWQLFIVFTIGMAAGTATPTPGGLGGLEAGAVASLVAYGSSAATALAAVLLYRLLTYWLPIIPGVIAFLAVRRRYWPAPSKP